MQWVPVNNTALSQPQVSLTAIKRLSCKACLPAARDNLCMTRGMRYKVRRKLANNQILHNAMQGA